jgi:hypothetical protein
MQPLLLLEVSRDTPHYNGRIGADLTGSSARRWRTPTRPGFRGKVPWVGATSEVLECTKTFSGGGNLRRSATAARCLGRNPLIAQARRVCSLRRLSLCDEA